MSKLRGGAPAPEGPFPILPLRTGALFPDSKVAYMVGRPRSLALIRSLHIGDVIGVVSQRDAKKSEPGFGSTGRPTLLTPPSLRHSS